jgi:hypothetical protein
VENYRPPLTLKGSDEHGVFLALSAATVACAQVLRRGMLN